MRIAKKLAKKFMVICAIIVITIIFSVLKKEIRSIFVKEEPYCRTIDLSQAKQKFDDQVALFLDVRGDLFYRLDHIKGAISFPLERYDQIINMFETKYPKNTRLVVYCDGSACSSSFVLARRLREKGYKEVEIFFGGWRDWVTSYYPVAEGDED